MSQLQAGNKGLLQLQQLKVLTVNSYKFIATF